MAIHPDAGKTAPQESLVNVPKLAWRIRASSPGNDIMFVVAEYS